jgi:hypothetical protein
VQNAPHGNDRFQAQPTGLFMIFGLVSRQECGICRWAVVLDCRESFLEEGESLDGPDVGCHRTGRELQTGRLRLLAVVAQAEDQVVRILVLVPILEGVD